jgi:DNA-binding transcriptional ArsR family regulator
MSALPVDLIQDPAAATTLLHPARRRVMEALGEPDSAAGLARRLDLPRQKVNYHLRELEKAGLVEHVEDRRKGNCVERIVRARATHFLISPEALGALGAGAGDAPGAQDRFSWATLVAAAARVIRDLAVLRRRADGAGKRLSTLTIEAEVRFESAESQAAFTEDLTREVARLVARHHDESAPRGRTFRFVVGGYPKITKTERQAERESRRASDRSGPAERA